METLSDDDFRKVCSYFHSQLDKFMIFVFDAHSDLYFRIWSFMDPLDT